MRKVSRRQLNCILDPRYINHSRPKTRRLGFPATRLTGLNGSVPRENHPVQSRDQFRRRAAGKGM